MKFQPSLHQKGVLNVLAFGLLCVGFFIFHIWLRTLVVTKGYEVGTRRGQLRDLEAELSALRVERNRRLSPESLDRLVSRLNNEGTQFSAPKAQQLLYAPPDQLARLRKGNAE